MSNDYYTPSGNNKAIPGNTVRSSQFNGNNDLVEQAFDLLPDPDDLITSRQNFVVSSGASPNLYELTLPGITVLKDGMAIAFKAHAANTGPVSVRVNGAFTRTVKNSIREPLLSGDIIVDTIALLRYDNTNGEFQMANAISNVAEEVEKARVYAANSQASAVNSEASAVASEVSRQASGVSAAEANVSRAAAAISAQNAAQTLTDIYARYLGSKTTYYTQRPDGSPLTGGELMFLAAPVNAGRGLYYYDFIDTSWKPSSDPQVATLVAALQTILSQHVGSGSSLAHPNVTAAVTGFMSSADKIKLDTVATNANNYTHPTGDGNSHVPATGTTNANKVLMAGATAGSFSWQIPQVADIGGLTTALNNLTTSLNNLTADAFTATKVAATPWIQVTFQNGWYGSPSFRSAYRKVNGLVYLDVTAAGGVAAEATVVLTLPVGYRPPVATVFVAAGEPLPGALLPRVAVYTDGVVAVSGIISNTSLSFSATISLEA